MKCFMGCEPQPDDKETFYVAVFPELTIYGHTINRWIREKYPEDWDLVRDTQARGLYWGCWHSQACPDGEMGSQDPAICVPMERVAAQLGWGLTPSELMEEFSDQMWPDLRIDIGLTTNSPIARILVAPDDDKDPVAFLEAVRTGNLKEVWNSIDGDKEKDDPA